MSKTVESADEQKESPVELLLTRRSVLGGVAAALVTPAMLSSKGWAIASPSAPAAPIAANTPISTTTTPLGRVEHAAAVLSTGKILVTGGQQFTNLSQPISPLQSAQIYNPGTNVWTQASPMNVGRAQHSAVTLTDGRVLVAGGFNNMALSSVEIYNPSTDVWTMVAPMPQARYSHVAVISGGTVLIMGGFASAPMASVLAYNIGSNTWSVM